MIHVKQWDVITLPNCDLTKPLNTLKSWTNHTDVVLVTCPSRFLSKIDCTNKSVDKRIVHYYAYARIYLRVRTMRTHYIRSLSMPLGGPLSAPNTSSIDAFHRSLIEAETCHRLLRQFICMHISQWEFWLVVPNFTKSPYRTSDGLATIRPGGVTPYMMGDTYVPRFWPPFLTLWVPNSIFLGCFWLVAAATNHIRRDWCGGLQYTLLHSHRLLVVGW